METDYKVLYRKYRPTNFDEIIGQKFTIKMLKNAIINNKLSHAYIFTGPRGTGKTSTAKIFAKTINCENPQNGVPCGTCINCQNINQNADIIEIDAASNNGVDEIRELINNVKITPSFSKYKVYIIDEVHMLSQSAFNALLLTLEEPPKHVIFILATTNIESVPITILSRCQRYDFKKIADDDIFNHLKNVCQKEKIEITDDALKEITYLAEGGLRDALSILNQLSTSEATITLESVLNNYGSVSLIQINSIIDAYLNNDFQQIQNIFENLQQSSVDYKTFIKKLVDKLFIKALNFKNKNDNINYNEIKNIVFELNDLLNKININIDPFLLIFMIFADKMTTKESMINEPISHSETDDKIIKDNPIKNVPKKEVETIKYNVSRETSNINPEYLEKLIPIRINNCFAQADKNHLQKAKDNWQNFITNISSSELKAIIIDCNIVLASDDINIVASSQKTVAERFNYSLKQIEQEYENLFHTNKKFLALSLNQWEKEKNIYMENLKNNYKYKIQEEPTLKETFQNKNTNEENHQELKSSDIINIFNQEKVEIQ